MYTIGKNGDYANISEALTSSVRYPFVQPLLIVREGEYAESVSINVPYMRIVGESVQRTVLDLTGSPDSTLQLNADYVELEHLTIRTDRMDKIRISGKACYANDCIIICGDQTSDLVTDVTADQLLPTWWICGDSTSAICTPEYAPQTNWTQIIPEALAGQVWVQSYAKSGSSTKTFIAEGRLGIVELCMRKGDKLFIQFSHNDEKVPRNWGTNAYATFPIYLDLFIDAAIRHDVEPVLMTPFERRIIDPAGNLTHSHREYPDVIRSMAKLRGVRLIDMEQRSFTLYQEIGPEEAKRLFMWIPEGHPNYPKGLQDNTHFSYDGAMALARLFREAWNRSEEERCAEKQVLFPEII